MKNLLITSMLLFSLNVLAQTKKIVVNSPIQCEMCVDNVYSSLSNLKGIKSINIVLEEQLIKVKYNSKKISSTEIEEAISKIGYDANNLAADSAAYLALPFCCQKPK